jgi:hypothetical protein
MIDTFNVYGIWIDDDISTTEKIGSVELEVNYKGV